MSFLSHTYTCVGEETISRGATPRHIAGNRDIAGNPCEAHMSDIELDSSSAESAALHDAICGPHSAALIRLTKAQTNDLRTLHQEGLRFFKRSEQFKQSCSSDLHSPSIGAMPVLNGYRTPSDAKELLRLFEGPRSPSNLPRQLRRASARGSAILNALLLRCLQSILKSAGGRAVSTRAMRRIVRQNRVLDIFSYHNRPQASGAIAVNNCEPHVDRGFLHAIVASPVDGLQLQVNGVWRPPHEIWPQITPHAHVIVFVNDALQTLSRSWTQPLSACTHRVVRSAAGAVQRLSISFELRPAADADENAWSAVL